jgi:2-keto-4-pentenoate hydratase/2-oxohepta-3-ene-1,7-dioic acid hydratase in catechol pathway
MTLNEGDMILTGTPEGASFVKPGDIIECGLSKDKKDLVNLVTHVSGK